MNQALPPAVWTHLLAHISGTVLVINSERQIICANEEGIRFFGIEDGGNVPIAELEYADRLDKWLSHAELSEWSPAPNVYLQPQVEQIHDKSGDYQVVILRDVSEKRQQAQSQHEFIRIVSHDLRSPLTSILGFAAMLEQGAAGELNPKQQYFAGKIMSGIEQIVRLVENIQDAGRFDPETGFYEMSRMPCDIGEIVQRVVQHSVIPQDKAHLQLAVNVEATLPIIEADGMMLERAVTNLVDNAIKYTQDGGMVSIAVAREGDSIYIRVRDNGMGVSQEDQAKLFQRHSRIVRKDGKKVKGSGLGLFIVRSVAQRHGGQAWVESDVGNGSTFTISLPLRHTRE